MSIKQYEFPHKAFDIFLLVMTLLTMLIFIAALVVPRKVVQQTQKETECYKETAWVCKEDNHLRGKSICRQKVVCIEND